MEEDTTDDITAFLKSSSRRHLGNSELAVGAPPTPPFVLNQHDHHHHGATHAKTPAHSRHWVRGVNLGGWLVLERFITPYQFAVTDCHVRGDLCWYPGQLSAPPRDNTQYPWCDLYHCQPLRQHNQFGLFDYPMDEYELGAVFANHNNTAAAERWFNTHFEHFVTRHDLVTLVKNNITHIRVPLPHWIFRKLPDEPWVVGDRWHYFLRLLRWCRELNLQVWPDVHTAPGPQNGFDNSGQARTDITCQGWSRSAANVKRSIQVIRDITAEIVKEGYQDVVTGFGLLNEPFKDCNRTIYENFINTGLDIVRETLGPNTAVYVSDMFLAKTFNNGWWLDSKYNNTYLDSHYYHVFAEEPRALSPRQHIAYVCQNEFRDTVSCCYQDYPNKTIPAASVSRMVGEWSAAVDSLPVTLLKSVMDGIADLSTGPASEHEGMAPLFNRQLSSARKDFLRHFVQAQMVTYEAVERGTSNAWFFWTLKMEGGAFAEWDFLRGLKEGWIPALPMPNVSSQSLFGSCYDIIFRTNDTMDVIQTYPDPATLPKKLHNWQGVDIDDVVVQSHGDSLLHSDDHYPDSSSHNRFNPLIHSNHPGTRTTAVVHWILGLTMVLFILAVVRIVWKKIRRKSFQYSPIGDDTCNNTGSIAV